MEEEQEKINDSPIEQVRLTVPTTDDPTLPVLTFRTWVLGLTTCSLLSFVNQYFHYRQNRIFVSDLVAQILLLPVGKMMARTLPTKPIRVPGTKWTFSLNPGPFNIKEHALTTILASMGAGSPYAIEIISQSKIFYHKKIDPLPAFLLIQTTEMLGYGLAGMLMKLLVESPYMWWPDVLVTVSFYRALNEVEERPKGQLTRLQFFFLVLVSSFAYYVIPNYLFPSITALSFVCWIWKDSVRAQQLGSGWSGLGIGSFGLDWSTIGGYLGSPLAYPLFTIINKMVGFFVIFYIITPIAYWTNLYNAKQFPIFSADLFDKNGQLYNISRILDDKEFKFDQKAYNDYSKINFSTFYALNYGFSFACITATLSHAALFYGGSVWRQLKVSHGDQKQTGDIHNQLMKKYDPIPQWWFYIILFSSLGLAFFTCEGFGGQLQLPFWGILLAVGVVVIFLLPVGVIIATSNQYLPLSIITELLIGYLYPGKPIANMAFKSYGGVSMGRALSFLYLLKQGHYMKIPPRSLFTVQIVGMLIASSINFGTAWWILSTVKHICEPDKLPPGSPWTCPSERVVFSITTTWGIAGPSHIFAPSGLYKYLYLFFLFGALAPVPVWLLSRAFPKKKWIRLIHVPILLGSTLYMPPIRAVHHWSWFVVGFLFNYVIYRKYNKWWSRYNYVLSAGLDIGIAFMALLTSFALHNIYGVKWWGLELGDHCPLAHCPTAPGVEVVGCPVFH
ncbi:oligopeptide transporter 5-like [Magnolia sinica]|uniref:oligopeptide transporter 5-like n=1 Tax=Magnolia sinica TaxID=86752 RepID=UPI0026582989|nr:oligopeptide transporter 5-like [Magnolia sinica]